MFCLSGWSLATGTIQQDKIERVHVDVQAENHDREQKHVAGLRILGLLLKTKSRTHCTLGLIEAFGFLLVFTGDFLNSSTPSGFE